MHETQIEFKTLMCLVCGWMYSEKEGAIDEGLAPGTRWNDVPASWLCPECGVGKNEFTLIEI